MIGVKGITKERAVDMLNKGDRITGFEGSFEIPLEALDTPVMERKVTSDQDVTKDATYEPVAARDCLRVLHVDDKIAIVSTEEYVRPGRYKNASPEWLAHLSGIFGADKIHTRSETHDRIFYCETERKFDALDRDGQYIVEGNLQATLDDDEVYKAGVMEYGAPLVAKVISEYEQKLKEEAAEAEMKAELEKILYAMTVEDKKQICRDYSISGFSSLNETGLVDLIVTAYFSGKIPSEFYLKEE